MRLLFAAVLATLSAMPVNAAPSKHADLMLRHVTIVDVQHARLVADQAVVTQGDKIAAVASDAAIAKAWNAGQTIDARSRYLIPGLWDMHVHFGGGVELLQENKALLPVYAAYGITTIRDCAGDIPWEVLAWRREIAHDRPFAPNLLSSGPKIEGVKPIWKGTLESGSRADVDNAIRELQDANADFVKITDSTLKPDLFLYALGRAHAAGFKTSGHIPQALTVRQAVDAGLNSIEHLDYAFKAGSRDEAAIAAAVAAGSIDRAEAGRRLDASFDAATAQSAYRYFAKKGVFVTPTLNGGRVVSWLDREHHEHDEGLAYIGPKLRKTYEWRIQRAAQDDAAAIERRHAHYAHVAAVLPMLQKAGVTIMAGTDAGFLNSFDYPAVGLHEEIALYVDNGLTPAQALSSATRAGPAWFGKLDQYGSIDTGKAADMVLLERNPLEDIKATRTIQAVVLRGVIHERPELDHVLADARAKVVAWNAAQAAGEDMEKTQLHRAAQKDDVAAIKELLSKGAKIDYRDNEGRTALLVAVREGKINAARALIEAGADVNIKDDTEDSPYLYAGAHGPLEILEMTLRHGADLKSTNRFGGTALIPACEHGYVDIVRTLIKAGVDVNHVNNLDWTALLEAIILGDGGEKHQQIVQLLVDAKANVNLADGRGVTPLQHARSRVYTEIAKILEAAGAH